MRSKPSMSTKKLAAIAPSLLVTSLPTANVLRTKKGGGWFKARFKLETAEVQAAEELDLLSFLYVHVCECCRKKELLT